MPLTTKMKKNHCNRTMIILQNKLKCRIITDSHFNYQHLLSVDRLMPVVGLWTSVCLYVSLLFILTTKGNRHISAGRLWLIFQSFVLDNIFTWKIRHFVLSLQIIPSDKITSSIILPWCGTFYLAAKTNLFI